MGVELVMGGGLCDLKYADNVVPFRYCGVQFSLDRLGMFCAFKV